MVCLTETKLCEEIQTNIAETQCDNRSASTETVSTHTSVVPNMVTQAQAIPDPEHTMLEMQQHLDAQINKSGHTSRHLLPYHQTKTEHGQI